MTPKTPMRVGVTQLEAFRLYREPDQEWMTPEMLVARLSYAQEPTEEMRVGSALDKILERPAAYRVKGGYLCDGFSFSEPEIGAALALLQPYGVPKVKSHKEYGDDLVVVAEADRIEGVTLLEFKGSQNTFDAEKYVASLQWRFMADIFEPRRLVYHVFKLKNHGNSVIEIQGVNSLPLYPYAGLAAECRALAAEFAEYVIGQGLDGVLRARQGLRDAA